MSNHQPPPELARDASELGSVLGVHVTSDLLTTALTHRSFSYERGGVPHNERLEFLGDSVLGIVVTDALYRNFPDLPEGRLAKMRASVVQMRALADIARGIGPSGLGSYVRLGRGEETTGGRDKSSILADTLEAVLGAIYLDQGPAAARRVVHELFDDVIAAAALQGAALDWKTSLQELTAELGLGVPEYLIESEGPDHERRFTAQAIVADEKFDACPGRNKKEAEQAAAAAAWMVLGVRSGAADAPGTQYVPSANPSAEDFAPVPLAVVDPTAVDPAVLDPAVLDSAVLDSAVVDPAVVDPAVVDPPAPLAKN